MKNKSYAKKLTALIFVIGVIALLVIGGPATAFTLNLDANKDIVRAGEVIEFEISIKLDSGNTESEIGSIALVLEGPTKKTCLFNSNGTKISPCSGVVSIQKINSSNYGYGYGLGDELKYKIKINTENYPPGNYDTKLIVSTQSKDYSKNGDKVLIDSGTSSSNGNNNLEEETTTSITGRNKLYVQEGDEFNFMLNSYPHTLTINNIGDDYIELIFNSDEKKIMLKITETTSVDLNNDGQEDFAIRALYIGYNESALLFDADKTLVFKESSKETELESLEVASPKEKSLVDQNELNNYSNSGNKKINLINFEIVLYLILISIIIEFFAIVLVAVKKR